MTAQREVNVITDCETFCLAFKLGAKIMLDVLARYERFRAQLKQGLWTMFHKPCFLNLCVIAPDT